MPTSSADRPSGPQPPVFFWVILLAGIAVAVAGVIVGRTNPTIGWVLAVVAIVGGTLTAFLVARKKGYPTRR